MNTPNILIKNHTKHDADPFQESSRKPFHVNGGKGDWERPVARDTFQKNFGDIKWSERESKPGRTTYRFGPKPPARSNIRIVVK